jgi:hypothetical protein
MAAFKLEQLEISKIPNCELPHVVPRLRDKGQKARELAQDMVDLAIPHQDVLPPVILLPMFQ